MEQETGVCPLGKSGENGFRAADVVGVSEICNL